MKQTFLLVCLLIFTAALPSLAQNKDSIAKGYSLAVSEQIKFLMDIRHVKKINL